MAFVRKNEKEKQRGEPGGEEKTITGSERVRQINKSFFPVMFGEPAQRLALSNGHIR